MCTHLIFGPSEEEGPFTFRIAWESLNSSLYRSGASCGVWSPLEPRGNDNVLLEIIPCKVQTLGRGHLVRRRYNMFHSASLVVTIALGRSHKKQTGIPAMSADNLECVTQMESGRLQGKPG